jgi:hypothetical protein
VQTDSFEIAADTKRLTIVHESVTVVTGGPDRRRDGFTMNGGLGLHNMISRDSVDIAQYHSDLRAIIDSRFENRSTMSRIDVIIDLIDAAEHIGWINRMNNLRILRYSLEFGTTVTAATTCTFRRMLEHCAKSTTSVRNHRGLKQRSQCGL